MRYAAFVVTPGEGATTFDALNAMLEQGWRVERQDVMMHEGRVTYAFLLIFEEDLPTNQAIVDEGEALVVFGNEDEVEDEDEVEALKRAIDWHANEARAREMGIDERFLSEDASVIRDQLLTRVQESFLILRALWESARFLNDEAGALKSALEIQKLLGVRGTDERWYEYLKTRATNPDDVEMLKQLKHSGVTHRYPCALSTIEEAILRGEASNFSLAREALMALDEDVEEAPTMMVKRARWAQACVEAREASMSEEMVDAFKRAINWEHNQHLARAKMLRQEHFYAPTCTLDLEKSAREAPLDFIFARQRWQAAYLLGSEWDMRYQAMLARRWLGEDVEREYARMERARRRALKLDDALVLEV